MKYVRDIIKKALYYSGYYKLYCYLKAPSENHLLILMYHDLVEDDVQASDWRHWGKPNRTQFEAHAKCLKKFCRVVSIEQAVDEIKLSGRLRKNAVAITFDDGYASTYKIAFPILQQYGLPATVYLPTDWVNGKMTPWWVTLAGLIKRWNPRRVSLVDIEKVVGVHISQDVRGISDDSIIRRTVLSEIEVFLRDTEDNLLKTVMDNLKKLLLEGADFPPDEGTGLSWEQIREMSDCGIHFGAHTCSHINLRHADMQTVEKEIADSKKDIETHLSIEVKGFAYPYGIDLAAYKKLKPILKKHNFAYACTAHIGNNNQMSDLYMLHRSVLPLTTSPALLGRILYLDCIDKGKGLTFTQ